MPESASFMSSLVGFGLFSRSHVRRRAAAGALYALWTMPASIMACWTTVRCLGSPRPSGVLISQPWTSPARTRLEKTGVPSTRTVSLPQKPSASSLSRTARLPLRRSISLSFMEGSTSKLLPLPLIMQSTLICFLPVKGPSLQGRMR